MTTRLLTFLIWGLVAASAAFWTLRALARPAPVPEGVRTPLMRVAQTGPLAPVLGEEPVADAAEDEEAQPEAASRFQLLGVVAPPGAESRQGGVALIAVDGKPARAWRTGALVANEMVLRSVGRRSATLVPQAGGEPITLTLPEPGSVRSGGAAAVMPGQPGAGGVPGKPSGPMLRPGLPGQPAVGAGPGGPHAEEEMADEEE